MVWRGPPSHLLKRCLDVQVDVKIYKYIPPLLSKTKWGCKSESFSSCWICCSFQSKFICFYLSLFILFVVVVCFLTSAPFFQMICTLKISQLLEWQMMSTWMSQEVHRRLGSGGPNIFHFISRWNNPSIRSPLIHPLPSRDIQAPRSHPQKHLFTQLFQEFFGRRSFWGIHFRHAHLLGKVCWSTPYLEDPPIWQVVSGSPIYKP